MQPQMPRREPRTVGCAPVARGLRVPLLLLAVAPLLACQCSSAPATRSTLVVALAGDPGALNPAVTTSGNTHAVTDQIFNGLIGLDADLNPVPELAEGWSIEDGGRTYRFALRRGVRWHDGRPFTSADVEFTFEHLLLKYHARTRAALETLLLDIATPDDHTAVFRLARPYGPLLRRLDVVEASIVPRHHYAGQDALSGEPTRRPVGTGPFRFVSYDPGTRVVLEKNAGYFRDGLPGVDRLVFRVLPNATTAVAALEGGEVDYVGSLPGADVERLRRTPGVTLVTGTGGSGGSLCQDVLIPNLARPPFSDRRVRRAFAHAIDREFLVERVYFGQGIPATGPISHVMAWAYTPLTRQYAPDAAKANGLLDQAGFTRGAGGERFALTFTHAAAQQRLAQAIRQQVREVGITLRLQTLDFNAAVHQVFVRKEFDLGFASFCNGPDPDIGVRRLYVSSNIGPFPFSNGAGYHSPRVDDLFQRASELVDPGARRQLYVEIQQALADDVPYFWIIDSSARRAHRTTFTGFRLWTGAFAETVRPSSP